MKTRRLKIWSMGLAPLIFIALSEIVHPAKSFHKAVRPAGRFTTQQIVTHAEPICRLLCSDRGPLRLITEEFDRFGYDGRKHPAYAMDCENNAGRHLVHTEWDAESGQLLMAAHILECGTSSKAKPSVATAPAATAWRWLRLLRVADMAPCWRASTPPVLDHDRWLVMLQADRYHVTVIFDRDTQNLVYFTMQDGESRK